MMGATILFSSMTVNAPNRAAIPHRGAGADLGGTKLLLLAETAAGRVTARVPTGAGFGPADLENAIGAFLSGLPALPPALGIAFPGLVDGGGAVVACDLLPKFVGWRPPPALRAVMVNDADAALFAEAAHHPAEAALAVVVAGTGIGAAFRIGGERMGGAHGWAGELGSVPIAAGGTVRTLDALASGQAVVERAGGDFASLVERARDGAPEATTLVREAGAALGLGLAAVIHLLDPSVLAVGGGALALPGYLEAALASARAHTLPAMWAACAVGPLADGEHAAALGAALAAERSADTRQG
jgi:predicted NBD/HSP70 family sugar kinase